MPVWLLLTVLSAPSMAQNETEVEAPSTREAVLNRDVLAECNSDGLRRVAWTLNMREQALDRQARPRGPLGKCKNSWNSLCLQHESPIPKRNNLLKK